MAGDKRKSPGGTKDKRKSPGSSGDAKKGTGGKEIAAQSEQKMKDQAMEELRRQYFQARSAIPPQIPKFFNLQIDDWNMNQYGSMMPDVERTRRMRQGEWLGLSLPHQDYDHDAYMCEIMPEFNEWRLKTMINEHNNQEVADKSEEARLRRDIDEQLRVQEVQQNKKAAAAAKRALEAREAAADALAEKKEKERILIEAELAAVDAGPVIPEETPQKYRRRVQLRQFRNQVERRRMEAKLTGKALETPSLPPPESDFYEPLPTGTFGLIQLPPSREPSLIDASITRSRDVIDDDNWEVTTFSANAMEHHPQPAETHYFDPEASTRLRSEHLSGDPHQTVHPYLGKANLPGSKYANWSPHPYLCDMDTLQQRFGSWRGSKALEIEPQVNTGNMRGERLRLGWGAECGENLRYPPIGLCNEQQFVPTEHPGHVCRVDYRSEKYPFFDKCPAGIKLCGTNASWPTTSRPGLPWYSMQGLKPEYIPQPFTLKPEVPAAGVSTERNVPLACRNHPQNIADANMRQIVLSKTMGQFVCPQFHPAPGDILILQRPRCQSQKDRGFVVFKTRNDQLNHHNFVPGDQVVRIGKFVGGRWKLKKHFKMFKHVEHRRWMIIGLLENDRQLISLEKPCKQKVATVVFDFWPRRGDLLLKALSMNDPSQLDWVVVPGTGPTFKPLHGYVILRAYVSRPRPGSGEMAGAVEMYVYDGAGTGWVFMGRDDCLLDSEGREI